MVNNTKTISKPGGFNKSAWDKLASAKNSPVEAVLLYYSPSKGKEQIAYVFGVNPSEIDVDYTAEYSQVPTLASYVPHQVFNYSSGAKINLNNITLNSYIQGKSLRPLIEGAIALTKADLVNNKYAPPILTYRMGTEVFEPCVITSVKYTREASLGGEPARIKMSLVLQEVPKPITKAQKELQSKKQSKDIENRNIYLNNPPLPLSKQQQVSAIKSAKDYLAKSASTFDISNIINSKNYQLVVDANTGIVRLFDRKKDYGIVVQSDGKTIKGGTKVTTLQLKVGQKLIDFIQN